MELVEVGTIFGSDFGEPLLVQNAGGIATEEAVHSVESAWARFDLNEQAPVIVLHHTHCEPFRYSEEFQRAQLRHGGGELDSGVIADTCLATVETVRELELRSRREVRAFVYDAESELLFAVDGEEIRRPLSSP